MGKFFVAMLLGAAMGVTGLSSASGAPAGYPVTGIDVSAFQGTIDWAAVATSGATFAYIRATEQANIPDGYFAANYAGAKNNGLYAGAYHRARPGLSSGRSQADYFLDHAQYTADGRTLPPMLDIEWPRSTWTGLNACYNMSPTALVAWIRDFVNEVAARTGRLAMIYTNPNWWNPCTASNTGFGAYPLFNSGYLASPPPPPAGWTTWTLWQYTASGRVAGITGNVDQDVFNGTVAGLSRLVGGGLAQMSLLARVNNRYVTADNYGRAPLIANRTSIGLWEKFDVVNAGSGFVALRAHVNGRYVTAEKAGTLPLIANRTAIGSWEKFRIITNADGSISLLANANGRYVTAENYGNDPLIANRTAIGTWEKFTRVSPPISLRANVNGRYVTADNFGNDPLIANRTAIGLWEKFDLVNAGSGFVALRARVNGRYVTAENYGRDPLIANRTAIGSWEKFRIITNADGSISLLANVNNRYVTAENYGNDPLIANRTAIGSWEKFYRVTT
jgi:GH25 family lysozyme M1 (1,4-beta-N-acetylmuramidase)